MKRQKDRTPCVVNKDHACLITRMVYDVSVGIPIITVVCFTVEENFKGITCSSSLTHFFFFFLNIQATDMKNC